MTYQNIYKAVKAVIRGKFVSLQAYLKKQEKLQVNNLTLHLKELEQEEQKQLKVSKRKEIIKMTAELNEIEKKRLYFTIFNTLEEMGKFFETQNLCNMNHNELKI